MIRTPAVVALWEAFARTQDVAPTHYDVWYFGDSEELARELLQLVLDGKKTATCGLLWDMGAPESPMPIEGGFSVVTDFHGTPRVILQSTEVRTLPFGQIDAKFALEEGEGTAEEWRAGHWEFFTRRCEVLGKKADDSMPVVCERFRVVFSAP